MSRVFLGIGSNEGDCLEQISRAVRGLRAIPGIELERMATIYETEPVGLPATRPFSGIYYVYAVTCEDGSIYVGQTNHLQRRWQDHVRGKITWTSHHRPRALAYFEVVSTREEAVKRERELKTGWGRTWLHRHVADGSARQAGPPQPSYLNTVVEIATALEPRWLLDALKALERRLGRAPSTQRWGPRVIDLDILLYDDRVLDEPTLSIPHPRMHERRFVLEPLAQLVPDLIHPVLKQTIARLLATLPVSLHHSPFIIQH